MKNRVIFWDWTGTLADESKLDGNLCTDMESDFAKKEGITIEDAKKKFKSHLSGLENTWKWHDYTHHGRVLGVDWKSCQTRNMEKMILLPHAKEILEYTKSKGFVNILSTNAVRDVILLRLEYANFSKMFDFVIACDDVQAMKSEGKHIERGLKTFGADAASSYSIGDNPVQDIAPAKKLGLITIFCDFDKDMTYYHSEHISANHEEKTGADFVVRDLLDIKNIVR